MTEAVILSAGGIVLGSSCSSFALADVKTERILKMMAT
jgi:hypothetical protein